MKNIFKIVFVIIGTLIGAGFASGQEINIFFFSYGINGVYGIIISSVLMGIIINKSLNIINKYDIQTYKDFINIIFRFDFKKKYFNLKNIFNIIINLFILITFFIMVAGFGAYLSQTFKINSFLGSSILAFLCFLIFLGNIRSFVKINQILIPILIILVFFIGILNINKINFSELHNLIPITNSNNWLISSILYCSYNSILLIPALITLNSYLKDKKQILIISIISIVFIILLSLILFLMLAKVDIDINTIEMPIVYVVSNMFKGLNILYGFVIISSIFTTSMSLGISFLQNFVKNKKTYTHIAIIMCITAVIISRFGFSNLVNLLYPIFGYLGIIQIFSMIYSK